MSREKKREPRCVGLTFTDELARAILAGTKTETRRPLLRSPKVQAGDELYARVTYIPGTDGVPTHRFALNESHVEIISKTHVWTPAIHMPKVATPFFLPLVEVVEENLHDITEEGAKAEGVCPMFVTNLETFMSSQALPASTYLNGFRAVWRELYEGTPNAWEKNPRVRVYRWKEVRRC